MRFDAIIQRACENILETTSTTTPGSTTLTTTDIIVVDATTTTGTTTCVEQFYGSVSPDLNSPSVSNFGTFYAGRYRVIYDHGAFIYNNRLGTFKINDEPFAHGFRIVHSGGAGVVNAPGDSAAYGSQVACEAANYGQYVDFDHAGGTIGMFLQDQPYTDNLPGTTSNPTFNLIGLCITTTPTTTPTTTTSTTTAAPTTTTTTTTGATTTTTSTTTVTTTSTTTTSTTTSPGLFFVSESNGGFESNLGLLSLNNSYSVIASFSDKKISGITRAVAGSNTNLLCWMSIASGGVAAANNKLYLINSGTGALTYLSVAVTSWGSYAGSSSQVDNNKMFFTAENRASSYVPTGAFVVKTSYDSDTNAVHYFGDVGQVNYLGRTNWQIVGIDAHPTDDRLLLLVKDQGAANTYRYLLYTKSMALVSDFGGRTYTGVLRSAMCGMDNSLATQFDIWPSGTPATAEIIAAGVPPYTSTTYSIPHLSSGRTYIAALKKL